VRQREVAIEAEALPLTELVGAYPCAQRCNEKHNINVIYLPNNKDSPRRDRREGRGSRRRSERKKSPKSKDCSDDSEQNNFSATMWYLGSITVVIVDIENRDLALLGEQLGGDGSIIVVAETAVRLG